MRSPLVCSAAVLAAFATVACDNGSLAGPDAQNAFSRAITQTQVVAYTQIVFLNDRRLPAGERLNHIDPRSVARIEIIKGDAAARLYGEEARRGVVRIYTSAHVAGTATEPR